MTLAGPEVIGGFTFGVAANYELGPRYMQIAILYPDGASSSVENAMMRRCRGTPRSRDRARPVGGSRSEVRLEEVQSEDRSRQPV